MEQGQYCWMQTTKRKFSLSSNLITSPPPTINNNPSYDDSSWEEQAFAEDAAAGSLGGCIWPPRSYSCSFCRREFRSAQALGGHMNVHRRDRARLKQLPSSPKNNEEILYPHHHHHHNNQVQNNSAFTSLGSYNLHPSPLLPYNETTNPNSDLDVVASASSPSPNNSKPLLAPPQVNGPLCNSSSIAHKTNSSVYSSSESWPNLGGDKRRSLYSDKFYPEADLEKVSSKGLLDSGDDDDNDGGEANIAVSLNLVICRAQPSVQFESNKEEDINCKRRKTDDSTIPFLAKSSSVDIHRHHHHVQVQPQVFELSPSSIEDLDLELRLGNKSKV